MLPQEYVNQGGGGLVALSPTGTARFAPTDKTFGTELVITSESATFSELVGANGYTGLTGLVNRVLPRGSYCFPIAAVTIASGEAHVVHS